MKISFIRSRSKAIGKRVVVIVITSCLFIGMALMLSIWEKVPISNLTRDINSVADLPFYIGFISQLGILFWSATVTLCLFSARILRKKSALREYLFFAGLITLMLCLDDLFLLHEEVFPFLGVPEKEVYLVYLLVVTVWLLKYYKVILKTYYLILVLAFGFLGISLIIDIIPTQLIDPYLIEDGLKFTGIVSWFVYFLSCAELSVGKARGTTK